MPVSYRGIMSIEICLWKLQTTHTKKENHRAVNNAGVTNNHNRLAFMFRGNALERGCRSQHKLRPALGTRHRAEKRLLLKRNSIRLCLKLLNTDLFQILSLP